MLFFCSTNAEFVELLKSLNGDNKESYKTLLDGLGSKLTDLSVLSVQYHCSEDSLDPLTLSS